MKLVLGTAQLGSKYGITNKKKINNIEIKKIVKKIFISKKINIIDTAFDYGSAHEVIGNNKLSKLKIITKLKIPSKEPKDLENYIQKKIESLLSKFRMNSLNGLMIHEYLDFKKYGSKLINSLLKLKNKNLVKNIGISVYNKNELNRVLKVWTPDIIQIPANVFDHRFIENNYLDKIKKKKIKIFCRSVFLQGALIGKIDDLNFNDKNKNILKKFDKWCFNNQISRLEACVEFIRQQKKIDFLVFGIISLAQLNEVLKSFNNKKKIKITKKFKSNNLNLIDPRKWNYDKL